MSASQRVPNRHAGFRPPQFRTYLLVLTLSDRGQLREPLRVLRGAVVNDVVLGVLGLLVCWCSSGWLCALCVTVVGRCPPKLKICPINWLWWWGTRGSVRRRPSDRSNGLCRQSAARASAPAPISIQHLDSQQSRPATNASSLSCRDGPGLSRRRVPLLGRRMYGSRRPIHRSEGN